VAATFGPPYAGPMDSPFMVDPAELPAGVVDVYAALAVQAPAARSAVLGRPLARAEMPADDVLVGVVVDAGRI
jgi:hypothetical protein